MAHLAGNCLWLMFERQGDDGYLCEPDLFFHRFRPYISSWVGVFEGQDESSEVQTLRSQLATLEALGGADSTLPDLSLHKQHIAAQIALLQRQAKPNQQQVSHAQCRLPIEMGRRLLRR